MNNSKEGLGYRQFSPCLGFIQPKPKTSHIDTLRTIRRRSVRRPTGPLARFSQPTECNSNRNNKGSRKI
ncbi:hypothetical protein CsatA_023265 [Cannabis sativa]